MNGHGDRVSGQRAGELLAEWVEQQELGREVPMETLCREAPALVPLVTSWVARLRRTEWLFDEAREQPLPRVPFGSEPGCEDPAKLAALVSSEQLLARMARIRLISEEQRRGLAAGRGGGARRLARLLIDRDIVTCFQLRHLCQDRSRELVLDDYLLLDELGEGGMGRVYTAVHRPTRRKVALKVMHPLRTGSAEARARFQQEVAAMARLDHPQIVRSLDAGTSGGRNYLVMEHVPGPDLARLVERDGPMPVEQAVRCIRQAAEALRYAHGEGIVHRDVKPSNLLLDTGGTVKVLDLGLARVADAVLDQEFRLCANLTRSGRLLGTVDYLAPEQARDSRRADRRCDIYSLGCTLYALLHVRPMYDDQSVVGSLLAHQTAPIPALAGDRGDVPLWLDAVFRRMVAKRPEDRFQDMGNVVAALAPIERNRCWVRNSHQYRWGAGAAVVAFALLTASAACRFRASRCGKVTRRPRS